MYGGLIKQVGGTPLAVLGGVGTASVSNSGGGGGEGHLGEPTVTGAGHAVPGADQAVVGGSGAGLPPTGGGAGLPPTGGGAGLPPTGGSGAALPSTGANSDSVSLLGNVKTSSTSHGHSHGGGSGGHFVAGGGHPVAGDAGHGALPFTGFDSLKLALIALALVVGGLLLMRMIVLISNDR
jgi:hypothetical protein